MVITMPACLRILLGLVLMGLPLVAWAETAPQHNAAFELPFDEDSEARLAEVERQVLAFLTSLHTHWGQSQDHLRRFVTGTPDRDEHGALVYSHTLADHGILEGYEFRDSALVRGQFLVLQRPIRDLNEFIEYYGVVKTALIEAFGIPAEDNTVWVNDLYQPLPDYWGVAVQMGHLRLAASWETPEGTLSIALTGNHHRRLSVDYRRRQSGRLT